MSVKVGGGGATGLVLDGDDDLRETNVAVVTPVHIPTWGEPVLEWGLAFGGMHVRSDNNIGNVDAAGSGDDLFFWIPMNDEEVENAHLYLAWDVPWFDRMFLLLLALLACPAPSSTETGTPPPETMAPAPDGA